MRTYELRTYTLSSAAALEHYRTVNYLRHLTSLAHHHIGLHGLWIASDGAPVLHVLVSFADGEDPDEVTRRYMNSPELTADMEGFDVSNIVDVKTTRLTPSIGSPLL